MNVGDGGFFDTKRRLGPGRRPGCQADEQKDESDASHEAGFYSLRASPLDEHVPLRQAATDFISAKTRAFGQGHARLLWS